ncbi:exosortase F system-associated protein [Elizabethkingia sp. JS20170427COW]|uniref:exosortase F system-associated membrane protein n=1 Tax=Elizabethkingia sp. JS20170427COW TaxID=2583851 RepID=UPI0011106F56|nr:exosortase F system-associated protein [Elizabethkingia sp. JS20170427COW]QCX52979.1 exosortase F system-associated protein [Elizabethkingia sp. JS20170427COW]
MKKIIRILLFIISLIALVGVRFVEDRIFYDPFLQYFHQLGVDYFPSFDWGKLILSHLFRFGLNLLFSCGIIYALFWKKKWVRLNIIIMLFSFLIIFPLYLWCLKTEMSIGHLITFYLRRFVIQPILLLLIIPTIFYEEKKTV